MPLPKLSDPARQNASRPTLRQRSAALRSRTARQFSKPPADLAAACDWAVSHLDWINGPSDGFRWTDQRSRTECAKVQAVVVRAIAEPSRSLTDLRAKGRLLVSQIEAEHDFERLAEAVGRDLASDIAAAWADPA